MNAILVYAPATRSHVHSDRFRRGVALRAAARATQSNGTAPPPRPSPPRGEGCTRPRDTDAGIAHDGAIAANARKALRLGR